MVSVKSMGKHWNFPLDYSAQPIEIGGQRWCVRVYYAFLSPGTAPHLKKILNRYLIKKSHGREVS